MDAGSNHSSAAEGLAEDLEVAGCGLVGGRWFWQPVFSSFVSSYHV